MINNHYKNKKNLLKYIVICLFFLLTGCSSITYKPLPSFEAGPRKIVVFFDGTHNNEVSDTNIKKLHSLISLQNRADIASIYIEGVGTGNDVTGMMTGYGIGERVRMAYEFILNNYRPDKQDQIYIFGFSRGAYAARILNSLLYHAGVPDSSQAQPIKLSIADIANEVYDAVKRCLREEEEKNRQKLVKAELSNLNLQWKTPVNVEVLGLWDTVEALGLVINKWPSRILHKLGIKQHSVILDNQNKRYGDKLCNVKRAYQALSIDDNREWIFTPLLLSRTHLFNGCSTDHNPMLDEHGKIKKGALEEVWFSGSHSDVGGGYPDSLLSGVSLNWMMDRLKDDGLLTANTSVQEDPYGTSHNPESGFFSFVYHEINRDIVRYITDTTHQRPEGLDVMCVHPNVFKRRALIAPKDHEYKQLKLIKPGKICLKANQSENLDDKGRLEETLCESEDKLALQIDIQEYPNCNFIEATK